MDIRFDVRLSDRSGLRTRCHNPVRHVHRSSRSPRPRAAPVVGARPCASWLERGPGSKEVPAVVPVPSPDSECAWPRSRAAHGPPA